MLSRMLWQPYRGTSQGTCRASGSQNRLTTAVRVHSFLTMSAPPAPEPVVLVEAHSGWSHLNRYFFYSWLFSDADSGSTWERSAARRRNRDQAKWLPTYLLRWAIVGGLLAVLEQLSERLSGSLALTAALAVACISVATFCIVTAVCWVFLRGSRSTH